MSPLEITLVGLSPGLFWLWYLLRRDPALWRGGGVIRVFALGCLAAYVVLLVRPWIDPLSPPRSGWERDLVDAFLLTSLPEELAKLAAFLLGGWIALDRREPQDAALLGAAAGLGFASAENVFYLVETGDPSLIAMRGFSATLAHVAFTGSLCATLGLLHARRLRAPTCAFALALLSAVVLHAAYNLFLWRGTHYVPLALLVVLPAALLLFVYKVAWTRRDNQRLLTLGSP
jgi:RsiW-degrading membrane proteinase PrsW (M82 family)